MTCSGYGVICSRNPFAVYKFPLISPHEPVPTAVNLTPTVTIRSSAFDPARTGTSVLCIDVGRDRLRFMVQDERRRGCEPLAQHPSLQQRAEEDQHGGQHQQPDPAVGVAQADAVLAHAAASRPAETSAACNPRAERR